MVTNNHKKKKEGRGSEHSHAGKGEGISVRTCGEFTWRQGRGGSQKRSQAQRKFVVT